MAPKTKKKAPAKKAIVKKAVAKKPVAKAPAKAASKAASKPVAKAVIKPVSHVSAPAKKAESCSGNCKIWNSIIALIIGAAAGYVLATL